MDGEPGARDVRREAVWAAAYGAAFAEEFTREIRKRSWVEAEADTGIDVTARKTDATARAKAWANTCADAAVASLEER